MPNDQKKKSSKRFAETWFANWQSHFEKRGSLPASAYLLVGLPESGTMEVVKSFSNLLIKGSQVDLFRIAPEKTSIKIETIREMIQKVSFKPLEGDYVLVVIEEAQSMTDAAANALLKTLEEPPDYALFVLTTSAPERLPATIRSRCQKVSFPVTQDVLREKIREHLSSSVEEKLFEYFQTSSHGKNLAFSKASVLAETLSKEPQLAGLFEFLKALWHDIIIFQETGGTSPLLLPERKDFVESRAKRKETAETFRELDLILETEKALEGNVNKPLALERCLFGLGING